MGNYQCRDDYIIQTNFDYYWHDIKEFFDISTHKGFGHSRRKAAMRIMNATASVTPAVLWKTITDVDVQAKDTIFQVIMNVETGLWNASLTSLTKDQESAESSPPAALPVALLKEWEAAAEASFVNSAVDPPGSVYV